ncbi:UNVERIFIED_CONTAM: hypothetical protein K2H54_041870 [Gekko kuhli]
MEALARAPVPEQEPLGWLAVTKALGQAAAALPPALQEAQPWPAMADMEALGCPVPPATYTLSRGPAEAMEEVQAWPEEALHRPPAEQRQTLGRPAMADTMEALRPAVGTEALTRPVPVLKHLAAAAAAEVRAQAVAEEEVLHHPPATQRQTLGPPGMSKTRII